MSTLLQDCWRNKEIKGKICKAVLKGDFKTQPDIGEMILRMIHYSYLYNTVDSCIFEAINMTFNKEQATLDFESKSDRRAIQIRSIVQGEHLTFPKPVYLDYGCGNGVVTSKIVRILEQEGFNDFFGIDIKPPEEYPTKDVNGFYYAQNPELGENQYGLITCLTVAHHFEEPLKELKKINKALAPRGTFILREFDALSDEDKQFNKVMDEMLYRGYYGDTETPVTDNYFSKESWAWLLEQAGFVDIRSLTFANEKDNPYKPFILLCYKGDK